MEQVMTKGIMTIKDMREYANERIEISSKNIEDCIRIIAIHNNLLRKAIAKGIEDEGLLQHYENVLTINKEKRIYSKREKKFFESFLKYTE